MAVLQREEKISTRAIDYVSEESARAGEVQIGRVGRGGIWSKLSGEDVIDAIGRVPLEAFC